MTYRERYALEGGKDADRVHLMECPGEMVFNRNTYKCIVSNCRECWDSTIPGTEDKEEQNGKQS